jgi:hypothetical protein
LCATAEHYTDNHGAFKAPEHNFPEEENPELPLLGAIVSHLDDISVAVHCIGYELEQLRESLTNTSDPVHTRHGQMTLREWEAWFGGSQ